MGDLRASAARPGGHLEQDAAPGQHRQALVVVLKGPVSLGVGEQNAKAAQAE